VRRAVEHWSGHWMWFKVVEYPSCKRKVKLYERRWLLVWSLRWAWWYNQMWDFQDKLKYVSIH
jgi:hypothetical protein